MSWLVSKDGYTLRVFATGYLDWGVEMTWTVDGEKRPLMYSPCGLSSESAGYTREDDDGNELEEGIPWTRAEWEAYLLEVIDDWIEQYGSDGEG